MVLSEEGTAQNRLDLDAFDLDSSSVFCHQIFHQSDPVMRILEMDNKGHRFKAYQESRRPFCPKEDDSVLKKKSRFCASIWTIMSKSYGNKKKMQWGDLTGL